MHWMHLPLDHYRAHFSFSLLALTIASALPAYGGKFNPKFLENVQGIDQHVDLSVYDSPVGQQIPGIIRDLLIWLEGHLDQPLSLDNVAAKAGYSKWHLQRMFKDVTGHAIGAYIRARRLSKSAVALRLTARPILDIALQYRFDSQQTFTRAFKKQFAQTPALYRRSPEWSAFGIRPPLRLGEFTMPEHKFVTLEDTPLIGVTQSYSCSLEQISDFRHEMRYQFWHDFLGNSPTIPPVLYGLNETRPSQDKDDEQEVFYTTALAQDQADGYVLTGHPRSYK